MVTKRDREVEKGESSSMSAPDKGKLWVEDQPDSGGMDELLEVLGYKVRSSDMAEVAQKLEELEMAMGSGTMEDGISLLSNDTVHFNPADLSGWVQSMLCEINNNPFPDEIQAPSAQSSTTIIDFPNTQSNIFSDHDLRAIPGDAIFGKDGYFEREENKRMKSSLTVDQPKPVVVMDSQETGVRLVHALMACAEAVQQDNLKLADALLKHIGVLAVSQAGAMRKVATYFAEGLARRIYKIYPQNSLETSSYSDDLEMHFYETCPYLKFAHFTANQAILEAFSSASSVHVVDFSLKQGMQWPALIQALAVRKGGPPTFRLTGIGPPQPDNNDAVQQVGWKLSQLAGALGVHFEFRGFVTNSLADLDTDMLDIRPTELETVAVNSVFELHRLLANPGHIEKVLALIKTMRPKIVTVVEQEANHNGPLFLQRFNEALHYYCTMFDSLESSGLTQLNTQNLLMSEMYLGKQICNVVASEGTERVERHEPVTQWRTRMSSAGFESVHLGSNAFKQASMLLAVFNGGGGYRVEEKDGCLMLDWQTRPLISTAAFQLAGDV